MKKRRVPLHLRDPADVSLEAVKLARVALVGVVVALLVCIGERVDVGMWAARALGFAVAP